MAEDETKRNSADLAHGIPLDQLPDGGMLVGHVNGEDVLLVRSGDEIFAVSPHCTHYNGPLAEGLVVGDTVRCPWHHACFDLRTGEALRAPALTPITCWEVELRDGTIRHSLWALPTRLALGKFPGVADVERRRQSWKKLWRRRAKSKVVPFRQRGA